MGQQGRPLRLEPWFPGLLRYRSSLVTHGGSATYTALIDAVAGR